MFESLEGRQLLSATLTGSFASAIPSTLLPAQTSRVVVDVTNTSGAKQTGPVTVSLLVSPTPDAGSADAVLVGVATRRLRMRPGQTAAFPFRFASPSALPDGTDYLVARIDGPAQPDGSANETVVVAPQAVAVVQPFIDLAGQVAAPGAAIFSGSAKSTGATAQVLVVNTGNITARGPMQITLYTSTNGTLDANSTLAGIATFRGAAIRAGKSRAFPVRITLPPGTAAGSYTLIASINSGHTIAETNLANNIVTASQPLMVTNTPPVIIDTRHHQGSGDGGSDLCPIDTSGEDDTYIDLTEPVDDSGGDVSPPPDDGATTEPMTQPTSDPTDSGSDGSDTGSDFYSGDDGSDDFGGGADF